MLSTRARIANYIKSIASGNVFSDTVVEAGAVVDTETAQADFVSAMAEAGSAADSQVGNAVFANARADVLTAADTETGTASWPASLTETLTAADTETAQADFSSARTETLTAADTITALATYISSLTESLSAADTSTGLATFLAALVESLSVADSEDATVTAAGGTTYNDTVIEALSSVDSTDATLVAGAHPFVPELGAGSNTGGGFELYVARMAAEANSRRVRKPVTAIVAAQPAVAITTVVEPPRHVVALEPVDLDEHDRELALVRAELEQSEPENVVLETVAVESIEPDEFAGYTQAAFDALRARAQKAHDRETRIAESRKGLYALGKKVPAPRISPVAYASALAEAQRQFVDDEELAMVLLIAA